MRSLKWAVLAIALANCSSSEKQADLTVTIDPQPIVFHQYVASAPAPAAAASDGRPHALASPPPPDSRIYVGTYRIRVEERAGVGAHLQLVEYSLRSPAGQRGLTPMDSVCTSKRMVAGPEAEQIPARGTLEWCQTDYAYPDVSQPHQLAYRLRIADDYGHVTETTVLAPVVFQPR